MNEDDFLKQITARRKALDISQAQLAVLMAERGHAWHAATVARTEARQRPVRLSEALDLSSVLAIPLPSNDLALIADLGTAQERLAEQADYIADLRRGSEWSRGRIAYLERIVDAVHAALKPASQPAAEPGPTPEEEPK